MNNELDKQFIWKKSDQMKYYKIVYLDYIKSIFREIENKPFGFYWNPLNNKKKFKLLHKYFNGEQINIKAFEKNKVFVKHAHEINITNDEQTNRREEIMTICTITDFEKQNDLSGSFKCGM